jgi:hypothetical protein
MLLDLVLPGPLSGADVRAKQLANRALSGIPTIVLTASDTPLPERVPLQPDAWLDKPFRFDDSPHPGQTLRRPRARKLDSRIKATERPLQRRSPDGGDVVKGFRIVATALGLLGCLAETAGAQSTTFRDAQRLFTARGSRPPRPLPIPPATPRVFRRRSFAVLLSSSRSAASLANPPTRTSR